MTVTASRASGTVTTSSASRALALADLTVSLIALPPVVTSVPPPSYGSVIVIPPSAFHDNDGGLPSYEQVLTDIGGGGDLITESLLNFYVYLAYLRLWSSSKLELHELSSKKGVHKNESHR